MLRTNVLHADPPALLWESGPQFRVPRANSVCNNRAATRVNILKTWEKYPPEDMHFCRSFANSGNPRQSIESPLQGGGSLVRIQHRPLLETFVLQVKHKDAKEGNIPSSPWYTSSTPTQSERYLEPIRLRKAASGRRQLAGRLSRASMSGVYRLPNAIDYARITAE